MKQSISVRFEPAGLEVEAQVGDTIIELTERHTGSGVPYSCCAASCGTCRVDVLEGRSLLDQAGEDELEVLDMFGDTPDTVRLCCQARLISGAAALVVLRVRE